MSDSNKTKGKSFNTFINLFMKPEYSSVLRDLLSIKNYVLLYFCNSLFNSYNARYFFILDITLHCKLLLCSRYLYLMQPLFQTFQTYFFPICQLRIKIYYYFFLKSSINFHFTFYDQCQIYLFLFFSSFNI